MSAIPPTGPGQTPPESKGPAATPAKSLGEPSSDPIMNSPWAKMFEAAGMTPTAKELHQMMSYIIKGQLHTIKVDQERMKKAMRKMKETIEGTN